MTTTEPRVLDVAKAASRVVETWDVEDDPYAKQLVLTVWTALVGGTRDDALALAQSIVDAGAPVTAAITPF